MQTENDSADFDPLESIDPDNYHDSHEEHQGDEEFSLDELRKVYAKVIQEQRSAEQRTSVATPNSSADLNADDVLQPLPSDARRHTGEDEQPSSTESDSEMGTDADEAEDGKQANRQKNRMASKPSPAVPATTTDIDDDDSQVPVTPQTIVEAILFVGNPLEKKLTLKRIASVLRDVSPNEVKQIILQLNQQYQEEQAAYRISLDKDHVEMRLDESLHDFQRSFMGSNRSTKLAPAAIEVLAIVAYNQPICRSRIDELRKRPSHSLLKQLEKLGLIEMNEGIRETPGEKSTNVNCEKPNRKSVDKTTRKQTWGTTLKFLEIFNLTDPDELPRSQHFDDLDELLA